MSPEFYTKRITNIANETSLNSLYPGEHYHTLTGYLSKAAKSKRLVRPKVVPPKSPIHVVLHEFGVGQTRIRSQFKHPGDFRWCMNARATSSPGRLVFLKGFAAPEWLSTLGSQFQVDPEFYQSHLSILHTQNYFQQPSTPSGAKSITLRLTTLGQMTPFSADLIAWRARNSRLMHSYRHQLKDMDFEIGDSIVREFSAFEGGMFSIEQDISIYLTTQGEQWTGQ
jgi:hypothetical protein